MTKLVSFFGKISKKWGVWPLPEEYVARIFYVVSTYFRTLSYASPFQFYISFFFFSSSLRHL